MRAKLRGCGSGLRRCQNARMAQSARLAARHDLHLPLDHALGPLALSTDQASSISSSARLICAMWRSISPRSCGPGFSCSRSTSCCFRARRVATVFIDDPVQPRALRLGPHPPQPARHLKLEHGPAFLGGLGGRRGPCRPLGGERPDVATRRLRTAFPARGIKKGRGTVGDRASRSSGRTGPCATRDYSAAWRDWLCCCSIAPVNASTPFS